MCYKRTNESCKYIPLVTLLEIPFYHIHEKALILKCLKMAATLKNAPGSHADAQDLRVYLVQAKAFHVGFQSASSSIAKPGICSAAKNPFQQCWLAQQLLSSFKLLGLTIKLTHSIIFRRRVQSFLPCSPFEWSITPFQKQFYGLLNLIVLPVWVWM